MSQGEYLKIIKDIEKTIIGLATKNGWLWFYQMHQKEVLRYADKLLKLYPKANKRIVVISCWLHDFSYYQAKNKVGFDNRRKIHHIESAESASSILSKYQLTKEEIEQIKGCILAHRNSPPYLSRTIEEKIVAVSDTLSHFGSVFYFTYFKFYPDKSIDEMVKDDLEKLARDKRDFKLLPGSEELVKEEYKIIERLLINYQKII